MPFKFEELALLKLQLRRTLAPSAGPPPSAAPRT
jgi:hypothetical protein